jgi:hypothetical protein
MSVVAASPIAPGAVRAIGAIWMTKPAEVVKESGSTAD